jgi:putative addiction module component (TIGR02574 family)
MIKSMSRSRTTTTLQARVLRALADRIQEEDTPLPAPVFEALEPFAPVEAYEDDDELPEPPGEDVSREEWNRAWREELGRRIDDVRSGKTKTVPVSEAIARIRARLGTRGAGTPSGR